MNRKELEFKRAMLQEQIAEIDRQLAVDPDRVDPALLWEGAVVEVRLHSRSEWRRRRFKHMSGNDAFYTCADDGGLGVCHWEHCRLPTDIIQWREHGIARGEPAGASALSETNCLLIEGFDNSLMLRQHPKDICWNGVKRYAVLRP